MDLNEWEIEIRNNTEEELSEEQFLEASATKFAAILKTLLYPLNTNEKFKIFAENIDFKILLGTSDGYGSALLIIEKGSIKIEGLVEEDPDALKKNGVEWDEKLIAPLSIFKGLSEGTVDGGDLMKNIFTGKVNFSGILSIKILRKLFSFLDADSETVSLIKQKHSFLKKNTKKIKTAAKVFFLSGLLHIVIGLIALRLELAPAIEILVTALIFAFLFLVRARKLLKLSIYNFSLETSVIITSATITFLNCITYFILMMWGVAQGKLFINILMIIILVMNVFCFYVFFTSKVRYEAMNPLEKFDYLTVVMIRGLGLGYILYLLAYMGFITGIPDYEMLVYNTIFGIALVIYGEKLYKEKDSKKVQIRAFIVISLAFSLQILLIIFFSLDPKFIIQSVLFIIILIIRVYYLFKVF